MDFQGDGGRSIEGGIEIDPFFPQVDQHASQLGKEVCYPWVYFSRCQYVFEPPLGDDLSLVQKDKAIE